MLDWLEKQFVARLASNSIRFLSIGAGTGIFDKQLIQRFLMQGLKIQYEGLDPNAEVLTLLENNLKPLAGEKLSVNSLLSDFESYETAKKFNFILLVHAHYFFTIFARIFKKPGIF